MIIKPLSFSEAMIQWTSGNPYLYRVLLCDDSNYGHFGHLSARIKLARRCTIEDIKSCKEDPNYGFVLFLPDDVSV